MTASEIVANVKILRPVSQAGLRIIRLLDEPESNNEAIVDSLKYDVALTAKVLRACNSPVFGFDERVESVDQAMLLLGYDQVRDIVLSLSVGGAMAVPLEEYGFEDKELWRHSLTTATVAEILANDGLVRGVDPSAAFTAGLLHDIGKLAFTQVLAPEALASVRARIAEQGLSCIEAEREVIGADHAQVGACLLSGWNIPSRIVEAVLNHHQPVFEPKPCLSALACVANTIAHLSGSSPGWEAYAIKMDTGLIASLELTQEKVEGLIVTVQESFGRVEKFMAIS